MKKALLILAILLGSQLKAQEVVYADSGDVIVHSQGIALFFKTPWGDTEMFNKELLRKDLTGAMGEMLISGDTTISKELRWKTIRRYPDSHQLFESLYIIQHVTFSLDGTCSVYFHFEHSPENFRGNVFPTVYTSPKVVLTREEYLAKCIR